MTKIKITSLVWDDWIINHIRKHNVKREEVEESINNIITHKQSYKERINFLGRTGKRILSVIIKKESKERYLIITARDAGRKERKLVYEKENIKNT